MSDKTLYTMIFVLLATLIVLFLSILFVKVKHYWVEKKTAKLSEFYDEELCSILNSSKEFYLLNKYIFVAKYKDKMRKYKNREVFEQVIWSYLDDPDESIKERAFEMVYELELPQQNVKQISSKSANKIETAIRNIGMYQYQDGIAKILEYLDSAPGDAQLQILMALARIGNLDYFMTALNEIRDEILVNQRAFFEILNSYSGEEISLYKQLLKHDEFYIVALALKAMPFEISDELIENILPLFKSDNKEIRISAIKAIGKLENDDYEDHMSEMLYDPEWEVKALAIKYIKDITPATTAARMVNLACDEEWWVRQNAAQAIICSNEAPALIEEVFNKNDKYAQESIVSAIEMSDKANDFRYVYDMIGDGCHVN